MTPLSLLMVEVLQSQQSITDLSSRFIAYVRAGIILREIPKNEVLAADQEALSQELARRISDAADEITFAGELCAQAEGRGQVSPTLTPGGSPTPGLLAPEIRGEK